MRTLAPADEVQANAEIDGRLPDRAKLGKAAAIFSGWALVEISQEPPNC
jgi:hypothetical protein